MYKECARRKARVLALQAIYQWQLNKDTVKNILDQFTKKIQKSEVDTLYCVALLNGIISDITIIDSNITPFIDRNLNNLDIIALSILRLATFELMNRPDVPYKVIINEALELSKNFGAVDSYKYINGVLDKSVRKLRTNMFNNT